MSGYAGYSMSRNAVAAYNRGLLPASKAAKAYGFRSTAAVRACVPVAEWHHTSKEYNATDFFDVSAVLADAHWRDLARWKPHLTRSGWQRMKEVIRAKLHDQYCRPADIPYNRHNKGRTLRLMELNSKYPTPYQRRNGLPAVESAMNGKLLSEANYLAAKAVVDARREGRKTQP